jgi:hypothetical protein
VSGADLICGSTIVLGAPETDSGSPHYGMSFALEAPTGAKGTHTIGYSIPNTYMKDEANQGIPLVGLTPGLVTIEVGQCCDLSVPYPFICLSDTVTAAECAALGGTFNAAKTCADACGCQIDAHCDDSDACTDDSCNPDGTCNNAENFDTATECCEKATGITCVLDDEEFCTADSCSEPNRRGTCVNDPAPQEGLDCDDGEPCLTVFDICTSGECVGQDILTIPCTSNADCEAITAGLGSCNFVTGYCRCVPPSLNFDIHGFKAFQCMDDGKFTVDVFFKDVPVEVIGGQFGITYDPTCMEFVSIAPGGDPFVFEIEQIVDEAAGYIFYAVGVDPFGPGVGVLGEGILATISFNKIGDCNECNLGFAGDNPEDIVLADADGQPVLDVEPNDSIMVYANGGVTVDVPDDVILNVDCDANTATPSWDSPTAAGECYDVDLVCTGSHESGYVYSHEEVMGGGEMPIGISTFCCTATDVFCGHAVVDCWTVEVQDQTTLDVVVQLSPIIAGDVTRCIEFALYADCVQDPLMFDAELFFGGIWDHVGHFTDTMKIPSAGQWTCITAQDQLHTLRASADLVCGPDGVYSAVFKGDPFFGGNWLINGNLDAWKKENPYASHDVIDIIDFAQFVANYLTIVDPNTYCPSHPMEGHADINGDGIVDALDFAFIMQNFLAVSKDACCPEGPASTTQPRTSVTVRELRAMGMGDLAVADLNSDGVVNAADMASFTESGVKSPRVRPGSSLRSR